MSRVVIVLGAGALTLAGIGAAVYLMGRPGPPATETAAEPAAAPTASREAPRFTAKPRPVTSPSAEKEKLAATPTPAPPAPNTATLILEADQPDTTVFIDRKFLGTAPQTVRDLAPGEHQLIFSPANGESIRMTVDVEAGTKTITARFKEIRLDERTDVVHKHGFGSCTGTLSATPEGLTYRTKNTEDAFTVTLTSIETFAMDPVEKNLKVKVKGGKTYNFADPAGSLDRLYAFHQAVEKARQRMLAGRRP